MIPGVRAMAMTLLLVACGTRTGLDAPGIDANAGDDVGPPVDPATFVDGTCSSWTLHDANAIVVPDAIAPQLLGAAPAGHGAIVGWLVDKPFGAQLLHLDVHGLVDASKPPVIEAPYQEHNMFQFALSIANSHGHLGALWYESSVGAEFTPVNAHGMALAAGVHVDMPSSPNVGRVPVLYATPTGFMLADDTGGVGAKAWLLDDSGQEVFELTPSAGLPVGTWSTYTALDDGVIVAVGSKSSAPSVTAQAIDTTGAPLGPLRALDATAHPVRPGIYAVNVAGEPWVIGQWSGGMSVAHLAHDASLVAPPVSVATPPEGGCWITVAHGDILCAWTDATALHVQAFGFDGGPRSPVLGASVPNAGTASTTLIVPTETGALVVLDPIVQGNFVTFSIELSCAP